MLSGHELAALQWRFPWAGLLILLPLALGWLARRRRQQLARYADAHLLPWAVARQGTGGARRLRRVAEALAWLLLALAAAGPRLPEAVSEQADVRAPHGIDVMVVLDVSASMSAADVAPDRLTRARLELQDLLARLHGERLGLLLYAGQAGVLLPLTDDRALFARALQQAGPALLDAPGTDLARALTLAREQLMRTADPARSRAVLLVSDADEDSLQGTAGEAVSQAVQALREADIPLYALVTASREGALFELPGGARALRDGTPVISRPALDAYRGLAQRSGGRLALVRDGDADWAQLYDEGLARLPGSALPRGPAQAWRELYLWPLGLALLLLLGAGWPAAARRASHAALLGLLLLAGPWATPPAAAGEVPLAAAEAAAQAWRAGQWAQALPLFERQGGYAGAMGAGAAAWQLRDHAAAARHFSQALLLARTDAERDDALYNLGSAHYAQEHWLAAAQAWRTVLLSRPGDARAAANLVHAEAQLARRARTLTPSDLRGRRGFTVEGLASMDGTAELRDEPVPLPELAAGTRSDHTDAAGAQLRTQAAPALAADVSVNARQLQSGLLKLERLQEQQRALLRGLLKQDRTPTTSQPAGAPW